MSQPTSDPTSWFTDLVDSQKTLFSDAGGPGYPGLKHWVDAFAATTQWQFDAWKQLTGQWAAMFGLGSSSEPVKDRRFSGEAWTKDPRFDAVARTYLAQVDLLTKALDAAPLDERSKGQWSFALRQVTDALSPANNLMTNPEAQQRALETGGQSLIDGLQLFTEDFAKGRISMTDESAFQVGENVATTPGAVIYQNELIQLIQYSPSTDEVYERPLVIVPPCINKFYILDLQPANSFVGHAVAEGHTVFLVSWRNAGPDQGQLTWDDYIDDGVLRAIDVALEVTGADRANTLGFCVGGTLLASALSILQARGVQKAASMTLLTTLLDFSDTGEIGLLVDETSVAQREATIGGGGVLQGSELAQVFSSRVTCRARPHRPSTCCTGTATTPTFQVRCSAGTSGTPTWRTTFASRAAPCRAVSRSIWAPSTSRRSCMPPAPITSGPGRRPMPVPNCWAGNGLSFWAPADTSPV